jgi:hypothetical protein
VKFRGGVPDVENSVGSVKSSLLGNGCESDPIQGHLEVSKRQGSVSKRPIRIVHAGVV